VTDVRPPSATDAFGWRFTTPLLMGSALNPINSSLIATALVPIAAAVHVSVARTAVLVSALYLASAIAQPTGGKLAEELGARRVFVVGIVTVLVGGLVGGFGQDLAMLVVSRVLIGIGTSAGYPSAMLLIRRRAEAAGLAEPPGGVLGGLVIAGTATAALGLPIGGVLVDAWGWRTTFFVNLPVAAGALAMALAWIPRDEPAEAPHTLGEVAARIDLVGIVGFGGTLSALLVFLMGLPRTDWVALSAAVVVGAALVWWELHASLPFLDLRLLARNLALTRTYLRFALATLCVYTVIYGVSQWLEAGRHLSARETGLLLLPMSGLSALLARPVSQRNLIRMPLLAAALSCLAASAGVLFLTTTTSIAWIVVITLVFGITLGTTVSANQTTLYTQVAAGQIGTASGLFRTFGYIGSIASSAIIAIGFHGGVSDAHLHGIALVMVVVSVLGVVVVVADRAVMSQVRAGRARAASRRDDRGDGAESANDPASRTQPPIVARATSNHSSRREPPMTLPTLDPTPALVVIDVQKGLRSAPTVHPVEEIAGRAATLAGAFRAKGLPVVLVNVTGGAPGRTEVTGASAGQVPPPDWADLVEALEPQPGDHRLTKERWGAFHGTSLDEDLRRLGVTQVVLAGVATSIGVESTAQAAHEHGYHVVLATDAMTDLDADAHHNSVERIFPRLGERATTSQLVALLEETGTS
jgi:nicotinamidase-related amidase/MFS family permease